MTTSIARTIDSTRTVECSLYARVSFGQMRVMSDAHRIAGRETGRLLSGYHTGKGEYHMHASNERCCAMQNRSIRTGDHDFDFKILYR